MFFLVVGITCTQTYTDNNNTIIYRRYSHIGKDIDARARLGQVERATNSEADTLARRSARTRQTQQQASTPD